MKSSVLEKYARRVPRYTSYPTAPHFHSGVGADTYLQWLGRVTGDTPLSLYFHVPFCKRMCWYCGCYTKVVRRYRPVAEYADLLAGEVALVAAAIPARPPVTHIHWGGGTPTILSAGDGERIMAAVADRFALAPDAEIAVEMDPRTMTAEVAAALARQGVNRASLGVQDFTPAVQKAINRIQPFETVERVVGWLRDAGIAEINFDLMYGLPEQTVGDVVATIDLAMRLAPARIALFGYAHVPWMKAHQKMIAEDALPDSRERFRQAAAAAARLVEHGYRRIGLDHFARAGDAMARALDEGRLRRNFQGYTTDPAETLIGLGASSIGALPDGYVQNSAPLRAWGEAVKSGRPATVRGVALSDDDRVRRAIIEQLMCTLRVDLDDVAGANGDWAEERERLAPMIEDGIAELDGGVLSITEAGRPLMRAVCAVFDRYLADGKARHSQAV